MAAAPAALSRSRRLVHPGKATVGGSAGLAPAPDDLRERRNRGGSEFRSACGAGAPEFGLVCVASSNLHMHRDVIASSFGDDELTAALLLHHELEHVGVLGQTAEMDESEQSSTSSG